MRLFEFDPGDALSRVLAVGGAYADLFAEDASRTAVVVEGRAVESVTRRVDRGLALRVLTESGDTRLATTTALGGEAALALAEDLAAAALGPAVLGKPAAPSRPTWEETRVTREPGSISPQERIDLALLADRVARGVSHEVKEVRVLLRDGVRDISVAGSDGRRRGARIARAVVLVEAIARDGTLAESSFEAAGGTGGFELLDPEMVEKTARQAAERAVRMLRARPAPAGVMPVILAAEAGGTFVHEAVGHPLEADIIQDGMSVFADRLGEKIACDKITVVDDATLTGRNGSFPIDDEGAPAERTLLIDRGVLRGFLLDERTAMRAGARSTGKGRRESFRSRPIVRMTNTLIAPGTDDPGAILRDTPSGLYVTRMGGGEVDTVTGHFVFEVAEAWAIRGGALAEPVRGATLTGNTQDVLQAIDRVGSDLGFGIGTCGKDGQDVPIADGEPTIRVPEIVVGGPGA